QPTAGSPRRAGRSARQPPPKRLPLRSRSDCALPPEPCWSQLEASWRKCAMTVPVADFYAAFTAPNEEGAMTIGEREMRGIGLRFGRSTAVLSAGLLAAASAVGVVTAQPASARGQRLDCLHEKRQRVDRPRRRYSRSPVHPGQIQLVVAF